MKSVCEYSSMRVSRHGVRSSPPSPKELVSYCAGHSANAEMIQMAVKRCEAVMKRGLCRSLHETLTETRTFRRRLADWYAEIRIWGVFEDSKLHHHRCRKLFVTSSPLSEKCHLFTSTKALFAHPRQKIHCNPSFIFL